MKNRQPFRGTWMALYLILCLIRTQPTRNVSARRAGKPTEIRPVVCFNSDPYHRAPPFTAAPQAPDNGIDICHARFCSASATPPIDRVGQRIVLTNHDFHWGSIGAAVYEMGDLKPAGQL